MAKSKPTIRTLDWLRKNGYTAGVVEKWNPHVKIRQDLFGFVDIVAFDELDVVLVQACRGADTSTREKKIMGNQHAIRWLESGRPIWVVGWRQTVAYKKDGTKAKLKKWTEKVTKL